MPLPASSGPRPSTRRRAAAMGAAALAAAALVSSAVPASSQAGDPPGNNGTIKVDGVEYDSHPNNEPHPGCTFQIDFYGFDQGVGDAQVTFALQAPTAAGRTLQVESGDLTPDIGEDAAGGGTDLDASETYVLSFTGAPHPKQGYHVKLTVNAPGSIGNDTKHKVFWVEDCADTPAPTTTTTEAPTTTQPAGTRPGGMQGGGVLGAGLENSPGSHAAAPGGPAVAPASSAAPVEGQPSYTG